MIVDQDISPLSQGVGEKLSIVLNPAINLAAATVYSYTPGFQFQLTRVRHWCRVLAGAVSYQILVGGRVAVASTNFASGIDGGGTLSSVLANVRGSKTDALQIQITSNGTGQLTDGDIILEFRPYPVAGESAPGDTAGPLKMG